MECEKALKVECSQRFMDSGAMLSVLNTRVKTVLDWVMLQ